MSDVENKQGKQKRKNRWSKRKNIKGNMRNRKLNDRNGRSEEKEKAKSKDEVKSLVSVTPTPQLHSPIQWERNVPGNSERKAA